MNPKTVAKKAKIILDKRQRGLYRKFKVTRTDGSSRKGQKHYGCQYFVLDLTHDKFAKAALASYAQACQFEYPVLSQELFEFVTGMNLSPRLFGNRS